MDGVAKFKFLVMKMSDLMQIDFFKCSTLSIKKSEFKELVEAHFKRTKKGLAKRES